jgi:HSP20 family molecular chaperone IbpA
MDNSKDVAKREEQSAEALENLPQLRPALDIYENADEYLIFADLPGVADDDVQISLDDYELSLVAHRRLQQEGTSIMLEFGEILYSQRLSMPEAIDRSAIRAKLIAGKLELHLPKSAESKPRKIAVSSG